MIIKLFIKRGKQIPNADELSGITIITYELDAITSNHPGDI